MTEQCIFSRGRPPRALAISLLVTSRASSTVLPLMSSVSTEDEAMALAQPKVWNEASTMRSSSSTLR